MFPSEWLFPGKANSLRQKLFWPQHTLIQWNIGTSTHRNEDFHPKPMWDPFSDNSQNLMPQRKAINCHSTPGQFCVAKRSRGLGYFLPGFQDDLCWCLRSHYFPPSLAWLQAHLHLHFTVLQATLLLKFLESALSPACNATPCCHDPLHQPNPSCNHWGGETSMACVCEDTD